MTFEKEHNKYIYFAIFSLIYLAIFFIFIETAEMLITKIIFVALIGLGVSRVFCFIMEDKKKNINRIRYLPIKVHGIKFSVTIFALTIFFLRFFV